MSDPVIDLPKIFISYRITDAIDSVSIGLDPDLTYEFGTPAIFRDKTRLMPGQVWTTELEQNAKGCRIMLVVIGATWQTAVDDTDKNWKGVPRLLNPEDWVRKEITFALDAGAIVIPVLLNGTSMPSEAWLKLCGLERLASIQGVKLRSEEYAGDFAKLVEVLRKHCPELPPASGGDVTPIVVASPVRTIPVAPALWAVPPYTLTTQFVGRRAELREIDAWAKSSDTVLVVEAIGGEGKSALTWEWVNKKATEKMPSLAHSDCSAAVER